MELVIAVYGDSKVGKRSLVKSFFDKDFRHNEDVQYKCIGPNNLVHIYVEKFRRSLSNPDGCIFVYDITSLDSFSAVCRNYRNHGRMFERKIVFGNKSDLDFKRAVSRDEVSQWILQNELKHFVGNAYTKSTIDEAFYQLIQDILDVNDSYLAGEFRKFVEVSSWK